MNDTPSLQGRWSGYYVQHGNRRGIEVEFEQDGIQLEGRMRDLEPESDMSIAEMALDFALAPGEDERILQQLRAMFPDSSGKAVRFVSHLPEHSSLLGSVEGNQIRFLKTYHGQHSGGFRIGERWVGQTIDTHSVRYEGRLDPDGRTIEGRWWIAPDPRFPATRADGTFLLERPST